MTKARRDWVLLTGWGWESRGSDALEMLLGGLKVRSLVFLRLCIGEDAQMGGSRAPR